MLIPTALEEIIPDDHPVRLVDEILNRLDWTAWEATYHGVFGQPPIHPSVMAKIAELCIDGTRVLADATPSYFVAEGNRRVCALKLLLDPDRAPAKLRKGFEQLAAGWSGMDPLQCVLFENRDAVDLWLTRIHDGEQDGIGRRKWNADQSQRHSNSAKNKIAMHILDYAEESGLITKEARKGKLTTATRYLTKKPVQDALGLDVSDLEKIRTIKS